LIHATINAASAVTCVAIHFRDGINDVLVTGPNPCPYLGTDGD
jgi:hypothetical protein